ncbi:TIGR01244 family sulfur transferase [Martelella sp. FLE1502]|uniref:Beta-lactamase hydrolase-like protein n=1 Tax=Martelella mediterranea DSM 17316 TaxID=1122214 RepID=A0A1U9Z2D9_9HYPH|nr:TIGR01244 family sulfur transferase [Martelella mediterranea]AQZ51857.1 Beta-lactamase hydrolase-like protein [Martelella mediterranea DSM 17316]
MNIRPIDEFYAVSPQITPDQIAEIKAAGFKSIVCNRPDGEEPGQPTFAEIKQAAEDAGLYFAHVPVGGMGLTPEAVTGMVDALDDMEKPVLAYCRSGARSTRIYEEAKRLRG